MRCCMSTSISSRSSTTPSVIRRAMNCSSSSSDVIQARIRSTDVLGRLGGDEFGVLLERCDEARKRDRGRRRSIRNEVEDYRFDLAGLVRRISAAPSVSFSSIKDSQGRRRKGLMSAADVACYSAKEMGRNQVHFHRDSDASLYVTRR